MEFTMRRVKKNEETVRDLLNAKFGEFKLHPNGFSRYDIGGIGIDGKKTIIEVKERRQEWDTYFIEPEKINGILNQLQQEGLNQEETEKFICNSINGKHYLYRFEDICIEDYKTERWMNATTAKGFKSRGKKVLKTIYDYPADLYVIELSEGKIGPHYKSKL